MHGRPDAEEEGSRTADENSDRAASGRFRNKCCLQTGGASVCLQRAPSAGGSGSYDCGAVTCGDSKCMGRKKREDHPAAETFHIMGHIFRT